MKKISKQKAIHISSRTAIYAFLFVVSFIYLYPIINIVATSGMDMLALYDPSVKWVPKEFVLSNYPTALHELGGPVILWRTIAIMGITAIAQTLSAAVVGYGFAKASFRGHKVLFAIMIGTFFVPQYVMMIPRYVLFYNYGWIGSLKSLLVPALLGQTAKHTLFILIFYQFFKLAPAALDEAAAIDGAGNFRIFYQINLRMAVPAIITVFVLSLVWNWNEVDLNGTYLGHDLRSLAMAMQNIQNAAPLSAYGSETATALEQTFHLGRQSAAIMVSILPLIIVYVFCEKYIAESIDMSGITGE